MKYLPVNSPIASFGAASPKIVITLILLLLLLLCGIIYAGYRFIRRKTREISRTLWGTDSLSQGVEQMKREYSCTPKSVSAMTSLLLPKIVDDFPDFEYDEMRERAQNVLLSYLRAIEAKNTSLITDGTAELKEEAANRIKSLESEDLQERFGQIKIHRTEISQYRRTKGRCLITFQTAIEYYHTIKNAAGAITEGSKEYKFQTKYNVDMAYIQDRNLVENELDHALGINCPNCGAPLSKLGAKVCEYCDTPIIEINIHAWSFVNIDQI